MSIFILVGVTRGDELIHPERKNMKAFHTRGEADLEQAWVTQFRDQWLAENEATTPNLAREAVYSRYEIDEVPLA